MIETPQNSLLEVPDTDIFSRERLAFTLQQFGEDFSRKIWSKLQQAGADLEHVTGAQLKKAIHYLQHPVRQWIREALGLAPRLPR